MTTDIPQDFKIEHDKLIYKIMPSCERLHEIMRELPKASTLETIEGNNFRVIIKHGNTRTIKEPPFKKPPWVDKLKNILKEKK